MTTPAAPSQDRGNVPRGDVDGIEVDDAARLAIADEIVGGEAARAARKQLAYAGYVLLIFLLSYGFPMIQAVFGTGDPVWLRAELTSPAGIAVVVAAMVLGLGGAMLAGRFRGPVVPPLPWVDLVLTTPIDRALALRRWWRWAQAGTVVVGLLLGFTFGAGMVYAGVTGPWSMVTASVVGILLGGAVARTWLWGQVLSWPTPVRGLVTLWQPTVGLRELHVESLRRHSVNGSTLAGIAMTGNLRLARIMFTRPVRRGRTRRLRAGRPWPTMVRRDLLGLSRQPGRVVPALVLGLAGALPWGWSLASPQAPIVGAVVALPLIYLGTGMLAEGLRHQADNVGTPALLGLSSRTELGAHLVVPTLATLALVFGPLAVGATTGGSISGQTWATGGSVALLIVAAHVLATFRGVFTVVTPQVAAAWYALPLVLVVILGGLALVALRHLGLNGTTNVFVICVVMAVAAWRLAERGTSQSGRRAST